MTMPTNTLPSASQLRDYSSSPNIPHVVTDNGDGTFTISPQAGTSSGAAETTLTTLIAGERNQDSPTNSYLVVRKECNLSIISKTTAVTIGAGAANDTHLIGLTVVAALTGTCVVAGFA